MPEVYLDNAATTPVDPEVFEKMKPYFTEKYGNPSALYKLGVQAKEALEEAREEVADFLEVQPDTCFFTGSATEANNIALLGTARKYKQQGRHIISLKTEHSSVSNPLRELEEEGFDVTYLKPDSDGFFDMDEFKSALKEDTILVSIMYVNNEIGTIQPIADIGREILKWRKNNDTDFPVFHTDACQATNYLNMDVRKLHVDLMTLNGSKIYGPKGVGLLFKHRDVKVEPIIYGGGQEEGLRSGTENVPAIVGLAKALQLVEEKKQKELQRLYDLQKYFWQQLQENFENVSLNGPQIDKEKRVVNNVNVTFEGVEGEKLLLYLDSEDIYCSTGSACNVHSSLEDPSVVSIISECNECGANSIRFSMGRSTNEEKIDYVIEKLKEILQKIK